MTPPEEPGKPQPNGGLTCGHPRATYSSQRCQDAQERTAEAYAVMRRDPPGLCLKKSEGNSVRLLYESMRECMRVRVWGLRFAERSRKFARILRGYSIS